MSAKPIPYLDGWRGMAIALVLFSHFCGPGQGWAGALGVAIFFVLSGLLMSELLFIRRVTLRDFFVRRANRIVPLMWLFVVCMAIYSTAYQRPSTYHVGFGEWLATLLFLRTYLPPGMDIWADLWPIGHLWSLNVEEHSYVYLAVGAFACSFAGSGARIRVVFLAISALLVLAINFDYLISPPRGASPWILRSECASLGLIASGTLHVFRKTARTAWVEKVPSLLPVLTFLIAVCSLMTYAHKDLSRIIAPLALAFTVVYLDKVPRPFHVMLSMPLLRWFGKCSFSLYIWQQPFYLLLEYKQMSAWVAGALTMVVGELSYYVYEDPIRRFLNRRWESRRSRRVLDAPKVMRPET